MTLIEAMIVLAVVAVSLALGVPAFGETLARLRVQSVMHRVGADLATARSAAIARRAQLVVCPRGADGRCRDDADWSRGWMLFVDADGNRRPDAPADVLGIREGAPRGVSIASNRRYVRYQRDGRSANSNQTVSVCVKGRLAGTVVVNNQGRVRSARPHGSEPCPHGPGNAP